MGKQRETVYLVDGTYTVFRSFFAIGRLTAPDGTPTSGVYGFLGTVRKIVRERKPDYLGVAFDLEGPTHRDEAYADYKAQRGAPPEELVPQFPLAMEAARVMGWPVLTAEGFEADDVIATLARQARERGLDVVVVTSDKDLYQLVGDGIVVLNPAKDDRVLDPDGVEEVFGVRPEQVVDVLALMGDASDNVPGVPGIGAKTAKSLVRRYGSLAAVLERARDFRALWEARERALSALADGDGEALAAALADLREPAARLAELEERLGEADDLVARFRAAAELTPETPARSLRKALNDLGKKTQPKAWLAIAEHEEDALFSRDLVTVRFDAPVELDLEAMRPGHPDVPAAIELFTRLGFRRLLEEMEELAGEAAPPPTAGESLDVTILSDEEALARAVRAVRRRRKEPVAFDTETDSLDARHARLVGVSFAAAEDGGYYLPVGHAGGEAQVPWERAREVLREWLEDPAAPKAGQNLKYDRAVLRAAGIVVEGIAFDTLVAAQLLDPGRGASHRLDDLARRYLGERMIAYGDVAGRGEGERTLDQVDVESVARYAVEDAVIARRLVPVLREKLRDEGLDTLFEEIEMPLVPVLEEMEHHGIRVDTERLAEMSRRLDARLLELEREIHELAGHPFNVNSPQQLRVVLFEELKLVPTGRRTKKTRKLSTGQEVLEALSEQHPLPAKVLEFRELAKLKGTYVDALPRLVDPSDGRIHTRFHQLGAATGRLSSSDPNLQNIPVRTEIGREIRRAFVPEPGWRFLSADYSQMELRILAHLAEDEELIAAFRRGLDIHRHTAALVAGVAYDLVTDELRSRAKAVNFGIIYGMSEFRLAREQGMTREEARAFIEAYFARYPRVKEYIDRVIAEVQRTGEVRTLFGRLRRFPELVEEEGRRSGVSRPVREQLLRQAVNTTIQGTGADIVKKAMAAVARRLREGGFRARMLLQVHDELLFEVPPEEEDRLAALVREEMEGVVELAVPLTVDVRTGDDWAAVH